MTRLAVIAVIAAAFSICGCRIPEVSCEVLAAQAASCDLEPARLRCDKLSPLDLANLADSVNEDGCDGFRNAQGTRTASDACLAFGWDCPASLEAQSTARAPAHTVLFVGGIDARAAFDWDEAMLDRVRYFTGADVRHLALPSWTTPTVRSLALWRELDAMTLSGGRVDLVCYAVAGIDCRYLASPGGLFRDDPDTYSRVLDVVASVTTVATPHRGTGVANQALALSADDASNAVLRTLLGASSGRALSRETLEATLRGLTPEDMRVFNQTVTNAPDVFYQSWAGASRVFGQSIVPSADDVERACDDADDALLLPFDDHFRDAMSVPLWVTAPFASRSETESGLMLAGPSDGMIPVESAKWGDFRGCLPADHYDVIGQFDDRGADPRTGFDAALFYIAVLTDLAGRGL